MFDPDTGESMMSAYKKRATGIVITNIKIPFWSVFRLVYQVLFALILPTLIGYLLIFLIVALAEAFNTGAWQQLSRIKGQ